MDQLEETHVACSISSSFVTLSFSRQSGDKVLNLSFFVQQRRERTDLPSVSFRRYIPATQRTLCMRETPSPSFLPLEMNETKIFATKQNLLHPFVENLVRSGKKQCIQERKTTDRQGSHETQLRKLFFVHTLSCRNRGDAYLGFPFLLFLSAKFLKRYSKEEQTKYDDVAVKHFAAAAAERKWNST